MGVTEGRMSRRDFLRGAGGLALGALAQRGRAFAEGELTPLNVLLIISDDLNTRLGCYGDAVAQTPSIDRLAAEGVRFTNACCQFPLCSPSRTSFLTGLRPDSTGVEDNNTWFRPRMPDAVTLPELFRQQGWFTARVNKVFHGGFDDPLAWDEVVQTEGTSLGEQGTVTLGFGGDMVAFQAEGDDEDQPDGQAALATIRLLESHGEGPFFIAVGFLKPHRPWVAPERYFSAFDAGQMEIPYVPVGDLNDVPSAAKKNRLVAGEAEKREALRSYYAAVSFADAQVGKVLDALDRLGLRDHTVVAFLGDNGYLLGEHSLWEKDVLFEEGARVPFIVRAPGMPANGQSSAALVELVDLYPTLTGLGGLRAPKGLEGTSFQPLLTNPKRAWKSAIFTQARRERGRSEKIEGRSMRTERWRYTEWDQGRAGEELYDHDTDPHEYRNLALDPSYRSTMKELRSRLRLGWQGALPK